MENHPISGYLVPNRTSLNEVDNSCDKWNMDNLSEGAKNTLLSIIDKLLLETSSDASEISLYSLVNDNSSKIMEHYSHDIEGYLCFMISQHVTTFFTSRLEQSVEDFNKVEIKSQENLILNNPKPFDLKVSLKNGKEYWIDSKSDIYSSINEPAKNSSISSIINETQKRLIKEWRMQD